MKLRLFAVLAILISAASLCLWFLTMERDVVTKTFEVGQDKSIVIYGENRWELVRGMSCEVRKDGHSFMPLTAIGWSDPQEPTTFSIASTKHEDYCVLIATNAHLQNVVLILDFEADKYWCADAASDEFWGGEVAKATEAYRKVKAANPALPAMAK